MKLSIRELKRFIYGVGKDCHIQFGNKTMALLDANGNKIKQVWETDLEDQGED